MAKSSGLGDALLLSGYDLSGDVNALGNISGGPAALDFTTINKSAFVRQGGLRNGGIEFTSFFDPSGSGPYTAGPAPLPTLPTTDVIATYCRGTTIANPAACINAKQVNFDPTRNNDGALTVAISLQANGYGLEWGEQLTAGLRMDTTATAGTTVDDGAGTAFGCQAYLQVTAFTGTSVDIIVEHSTNGSVWATLLDFGAQAAIGASRVATSNSTTVNQYVRASTGTGTFSSVTFSVVLVRNSIAGVVF